VSEREKKIAGDWYEIRSALDDPDTLTDYLGISAPEFHESAEKLRFSIDRGIVEYKTELIHSIMSPLKSLKWDSKAIATLDEVERPAAIAVLTSAVQRLFSLGKMRLYTVRGEVIEEESDKKGAENDEAPDIKTIVADVQDLVKQKPALRANTEVKRIMAQLKYYNTQLEKMRSLEPNIPPEKRTDFRGNFQATFNEIVQKIRSAYQTLLDQEFQENKPPETRPLLKRYDFSGFDHLYRDQVQNAARIYSTIGFAKDERFQMREVLVDLAAGEPYYTGSFTKELELYKRLAPFGEDNLKISRAFSDQLSRYFERYAEWIRHRE